MRCVCRVPACFSGRGAASRSRRRALASPSAPRAHSSLHADGTIGALFHYERCGLGPRWPLRLAETPAICRRVCHTHTAPPRKRRTKKLRSCKLHPQRGKAQATLESNVTKKTFLQRHPRTGLRAGRARGGAISLDCVPHPRRTLRLRAFAGARNAVVAPTASREIPLAFVMAEGRDGASVSAPVVRDLESGWRNARRKERNAPKAGSASTSA